MNARICTENNSTWLECEYDPARLDWNEAIAAALASFGVRAGQLNVICKPARSSSNNNSQLPIW